MRIYVDTNVFLDFLLDRSDGRRPLGQLAEQAFESIVLNKDTLIISDHLLRQIEKHYDILAFNDFLKKFHIVEKALEEDNDWNIARGMTEKNVEDAVHLILAKRAKCKFLVTRNFSDFVDLAKGEIEITIPELLF